MRRAVQITSKELRFTQFKSLHEIKSYLATFDTPALKALGERIGVNWSALYQIKVGNSTPHYKTLVALSRHIAQAN